jgi:hypothetical protein
VDGAAEQDACMAERLDHLGIGGLCPRIQSCRRIPGSASTIAVVPHKEVYQVALPAGVLGPTTA